MSVSRVLVAERGPMAAHLVEVYEGLGVETVVLFDLDDEAAPHLDRASFATHVPLDAPPRALIDAANDAGCDALHPGVGPLAEDAAFAQLVGRSNLLFIGPSAALVGRLADRWSTREAALAARVPVVPGSPLLGPSSALHDAVAACVRRLGLPLWIKDAAGRLAERVDNEPQAENRLRERALGGERLWVEGHVRQARHLVVPVVGDARGGAVALGPIGRARRQDGRLAVDEYPASVEPGLAISLNRAAEAVVRATGFQGVGSAGFLVDPAGGAWCLGLRPRPGLGALLVDHVQGTRLPEVQLRVAMGEALGWDARALHGEGVALGLRVRAQSQGTLGRLEAPEGVEWVTALGEGCAARELLGVLVAQAPTRQACVVRASAALRGLVVEGVETNAAALLEALGQHGFWRDDVEEPDVDTAPDPDTAAEPD